MSIQFVVENLRLDSGEQPPDRRVLPSRAVDPVGQVNASGVAAHSDTEYRFHAWHRGRAARIRQCRATVTTSPHNAIVRRVMMRHRGRDASSSGQLLRGGSSHH
uniref:Uncharacterized protein n=1 Tax=Odontella aurita TaxID=265563 RepID=A0A7S4K0H1_9STRA